MHEVLYMQHMYEIRFIYFIFWSYVFWNIFSFFLDNINIMNYYTVEGSLLNDNFHRESFKIKNLVIKLNWARTFVEKDFFESRLRLQFFASALLKGYAILVFFVRVSLAKKQAWSWCQPATKNWATKFGERINIINAPTC